MRNFGYSCVVFDSMQLTYRQKHDEEVLYFIYIMVDENGNVPLKGNKSRKQSLS